MYIAVHWESLSPRKLKQIGQWHKGFVVNTQVYPAAVCVEALVSHLRAEYRPVTATRQRRRSILDRGRATRMDLC